MKKKLLKIVSIELCLFLLLGIALFSGCIPGEAAYINNPIVAGTPGSSLETPIYVVTTGNGSGEIGPHAETHETGGDDEINIAGLSGNLTGNILESMVAKGTWTNSGTWTVPAMTLGGNITANGKYIECGSDWFSITSSGLSKGFYALGTYDGAYGPSITLDHDGGSPADNDYVGLIVFRGKDSLNNLTYWGDFRVQATDVTHGSEDSEYRMSLMDNGTDNLAMRLLGNGAMYVDDDYYSFDEYDDALLLKQGISEGNKQLLVDAGILDYIPSDNGTGGSYLVNVQNMMRLTAGAAYQNRDYIEALEARIAVLEAEILKLTAK